MTFTHTLDIVQKQMMAHMWAFHKLQEAMDIPAMVQRWPKLTKPFKSFDVILIILATSLSSIVLLQLTTMAFFEMNRRNRSSGKVPPAVPHCIPFVGHGFSLAWNSKRFINTMWRRYGYESPIIIHAGNMRLCFIMELDHVKTVLKSFKILQARFSHVFALEYIFGTRKKSVAFYAADDLGMAPQPQKGSKIKQEDRINYWQASISHKFLSSQDLQTISQEFFSTLQRDLDTQVGYDWVDISDLYRFLQIRIDSAMLECVMGPVLFERYPTVVKNFWEFEDQVLSLSRCLPRWIIPTAFKVRRRLLKGIKSWQRFAHARSEYSGLEPEDSDRDFDKYLGSKLMRAREYRYTKMSAINEDTRASETLGLMFASNANTIPAVFWYIFEALRDSSLQRRLVAETAPCYENGSLNLARLCNQPLLQSTHAEVLRTRIAIATTHLSHTDDLKLGNYTIPKNLPIAFFSHISGHDERAWVSRPRTLIHRDDEPSQQLVAAATSTTSNKSSSAQPEPKRATSTSASPSPSSSAPTMRFTLDHLDGCWLPHGGGQRMCPGRHLAKNEIFGTFSLLFRRYDVELWLDPPAADALQPNGRRVPFGGLPPCRGKVSVRMRRKREGEGEAEDGSGC